MTLRCVECLRDGLERVGQEYLCRGCGANYPIHSAGIPILIGRGSRLDRQAVAKAPLRADLDLGRARRHWRAPRLQEFLARARGPRLLSYGCGDGGDKAWLSERFQVTGIDIYPAPNTDYVCDGHALPFADGSFDVVTSLSVLQILHDPFQAAREIARVLRPGGAFVGSVAFLEPHQDGSHFHMSPLGLREVLSRAGFTAIEVDAGWSWLEALAPGFWVWNRLSPALRRASRQLSAAKIQVGQALDRAWNAVRGRAPPESHRLAFAGALVFHAVR